MKKLIILFLLFTFNLLTAEVADHFKEVQEHPSGHSMENVDFIYVINLDQRPEKFQMTLDELLPYGIVPFRFSAVNGWQLTNDDLWDLGLIYESWMKKDIMGTSYITDDGKPTHRLIEEVGESYFSHCMSRGAVGIVMSHLSILQDAYDQGYETIWVMEDDIQVMQDPHLISERIAELDRKVGRKGWDILFTDQDTRNHHGEYVPCLGYAKRPNFSPRHTKRFSNRKDVDVNFRKIGARFGAYSMIVRRSGMKKILDFIKRYKVFLPYDMEFYLPNNIRLYTVRDDIVTTKINGISDNGSPPPDSE